VPVLEQVAQGSGLVLVEAQQQTQFTDKLSGRGLTGLSSPAHH